MILLQLNGIELKYKCLPTVIYAITLPRPFIQFRDSSTLNEILIVIMHLLLPLQMTYVIKMAVIDK